MSEGPAAGEPVRRRTRDPEAKKAAILHAARTVFGERGYAASTVREIARRAGVGHGLVMLHFSSKENLFHAAVHQEVNEGAEPERTSFPAGIARRFVERMERRDPADPLITLIRSAATDHVEAGRLLVAMHESGLDTYASLVPVAERDARVGMLGAHLLGVAFARYILQVGPLVERPTEDLIADLTTVVDCILFR